MGLLKDGSSATEAAVAAMKVLEDSSLTNAGSSKFSRFASVTAIQEPLEGLVKSLYCFATNWVYAYLSLNVFLVKFTHNSYHLFNFLIQIMVTWQSYVEKNNNNNHIK